MRSDMMSAPARGFMHYRKDCKELTKRGSKVELPRRPNTPFRHREAIVLDAGTIEGLRPLPDRSVQPTNRELICGQIQSGLDSSACERTPPASCVPGSLPLPTLDNCL